MNIALDAATIAQHYRGRRTSRGWRMHCPAHDDRSPSCTIADGANGRPIFKCWANCTFKDVRGALIADGMWPVGAETVDREEVERRRQIREAREEAENKAREAEALAQWMPTTVIHQDEPVGRYLASRGFSPPYPPCLRSGIYTARSGRTWPALIAGACRYPGNSIVCVQATPLTEDGRKAWTAPSRITTGRLPGAAVRLSPWKEGQRIVLTEGVEDALAVVATCPDVAAWSVLGTANASMVQLPIDASIVLALDGDDPGRKASAEAAQAMRKRGLAVFLADLPDGLDPAALVQGAQV